MSLKFGQKNRQHRLKDIIQIVKWVIIWEKLGLFVEIVCINIVEKDIDQNVDDLL